MSRSLVAIVGRPNVGKSTLFNRIVGSRRAIVDDMPGVTRDRHYAEAEWAGRDFILIDTGGFVPESRDTIERAVREQAQAAIEEADTVLFVVDGKTGPLPEDHEIARILRKAGKQVLLVVNKTESEQRRGAAADFFALGLGDPIPVSAKMGLRVGDLLDAATSGLRDSGEESTDARLKIAILGRPNVGKSSLVNVLLGKQRNIVTDVPGTTRDPIDSIVRQRGEEFILIDTAGLRRRSRITESVEFYSTVRTLKSLERCDVVVILLDASEGVHHQDLRIIEQAMARKRPTILAVNKWDLIEKDHRTAVEFEKLLQRKLRTYDFIPVVFVSARTRQRTSKVLDLVRAVDSEQNKRISTGKLNDLIGEDIRAFPPRSKSGRELRINYVAQVKVKPPVFSFFCNEPNQVDRNYRRYLENSLRRHFAFTGVPLVLSFRKK